jgi:LmbE family N-acetylglucosaminyl deacetylase
MNPSQSTASKAARFLTFGLSDKPSARLLLRRAVFFFFRAAIRLRSRPFPFDSMASALVIAPHPDDEALGCGGTLALMARRQARLNLIFLTDGSASHPGHPTVSPSEIARRRKSEAHAALAALGVTGQRATFLDARDGALSHLDEGECGKLEARIATLLTQEIPAAVFLPGRRDGSTEHEAAFALFARSLGQAGLQPRVFEFPVWSWWNPTLLLGPLFSCRRIWRADIRPVLEMKVRALASYSSQALPIPPQLDPALPPGFAAMFLGGDEYFFEW